MDYFDEKQIDWKIINSYFNSNRYYFTTFQIDSYNDFVLNKLPYTIKALNPITMLKKHDNGNIKHEVNIYVGHKDGDKIYLGKPILYVDKRNKPLYPNEARLKDLSYMADLNVDIFIEYITYDTNSKKISEQSHTITKKNLNIGKIPIMVHSKLCILNNQPSAILREMGECPFDQGGYFIISGKEKTIISQERIKTNKIFIEKSKDDKFSYTGLIRCTSQENALFPKTVRFFVYSDKYRDGIRKNAILVTCPNIKEPIPLFILFRALGIESDKEILSYILYDINNKSNKKLLKFLRHSIIDSNTIYTQKDAINFISNHVEYKNSDNTKFILSNDLFPNVGKNFIDKAYFLGYLINKLIKVELNIEKATNKDNYLYKRVDLSGFLISNLFRDLYNKLRNNIRDELDKQYLYGNWKESGNIRDIINIKNFNRIFDSNIITENITKSFKGNWAGVMNDASKEGIIQDLNRLSYLGYLSHVRRVNTPLDRSTKLVEPHRLGNTQFGAMCPIESPDGANIGLLKHFPIFSIVSNDIDPSEIIRCCRDHDMLFLSEVSPQNIFKSVKVFVNNNWIGIHYQPHIFHKKLKLFKQTGIINPLISISWYVQDNEIHIQTDSGRVLRPLYIVNNSKKNNNVLNIDLYENKKQLITDNINWKHLIKGKLIKDLDIYSNKYNDNLLKTLIVDNKLNYDKLRENSGILEYVDIEESTNGLIAMNRKYLENKNNKYTHCEIDPSTIFSVYTNIIPFSNHNPYPRNAFGCQQGKQAIGVYATNFNNRIDTASYIIHYPQRAIVHTKYSKYTHNDELPNGENLIVAIMTYTGFNQEDSIIVNKNSIERGMFNISKFKSYINEESKNGDEQILFSNPLELIKKGNQIKFKLANWDFIDEFGLPKEGVYIDEDDVILGKVATNIDYVDDNDEEQIFNKKIKNISYVDKSVIGNKIIKGFVDKVFVYKNNENMKKVKIRLRKTMKPELGDKMSSRAGQKGVCGMIYSQEDMPFNKDGIVPDIIINPHAIPTRATIGQLIECVLCKLGCKYAATFDGTAFNNQNSLKLFKSLNNGNLHRYSDEILYNGFTGTQMPCHIFFGPTYYYRLKHMVSDKVNYRTTGPITSTSRQPTKGRANGGGLRIGEMETNAILGHGLGSFIKESMMERSDKYNYSIENNNSTIAFYNNKTGDIRSSYKDDNVYDYSNVETPYSFKLLVQEIENFGIKTQLYTDTKNKELEDYYLMNEGDTSEEEDENEK